jgi:phosphate transport system ATP-binding protein
MESKTKIKVEVLNVYYSNILVLKNINLEIYNNEILSIIGPANSGKTSFLRMLNRLNDINTNFKFSGSIAIDNKNIYKDMSETSLRRIAGMVFALPIALPMSIFDNVAYGPRMNGIKDKNKLTQIVKEALQASYLWEEVHDRLDLFALKLSGGQQQRLCLARILANKPEILLFDEPCSGLDPISTAKVEESMLKLKEKYTIILVTNNTKQAARVSDRCAFFLMGELVEIDKTSTMFTTPKDKRTEDYITGKFG